ncbi:hypothetical protein S245_011332 [Arachis hypogaea]
MNNNDRELLNQDAIILARNLHFKKVLIESYNLQIIQALKSKSIEGEAEPIPRDVLDWMEEMQNCRLTWVSREANNLAHTAATLESDGKLRRNWSRYLPSELREILRDETPQTNRLGFYPSAESARYNSGLEQQRSRNDHNHPHEQLTSEIEVADMNIPKQIIPVSTLASSSMTQGSTPRRTKPDKEEGETRANPSSYSRVNGAGPQQP